MRRLLVVAEAAASELVVVGADVGIVQGRGGGLQAEGVDESVVVDEPGVHGFQLAGLAGDGRGAGVVLAGLGVGVAAGGVAELCEHPGAEDRTEAGLAAVDLNVRVQAKSGLDLALEGGDLGVQRGQDRRRGADGGRVGAGHDLGLAEVLSA